MAGSLVYFVTTSPERKFCVSMEFTEQEVLVLLKLLFNGKVLTSQ